MLRSALRWGCAPRNSVHAVKSALDNPGEHRPNDGASPTNSSTVLARPPRARCRASTSCWRSRNPCSTTPTHQPLQSRACSVVRADTCAMAHFMFLRHRSVETSRNTVTIICLRYNASSGREFCRSSPSCSSSPPHVLLSRPIKSTSRLLTTSPHSSSSASKQNRRWADRHFRLVLHRQHSPAALLDRFHKGVQIRLIGDRGSIFEIDLATKNTFYYLASQGIPIRLRVNPMVVSGNRSLEGSHLRQPGHCRVRLTELHAITNSRHSRQRTITTSSPCSPLIHPW